jgi:hypothetical protein
MDRAVFPTNVCRADSEGDQMSRYHSPREYLDEARSPNTSAQRLDILADTEWEFVRAAVAANPNVSTQTLNGLTPRGMRPLDDGIALEIAGRSDASPEALRTLTRRFLEMGNWTGRGGTFQLGLTLLANPSTPADAIADLTDPKRTTVHFRMKAAAFVRNPRALERLRNDNSERVRRRAVRIADATET